MGSRAGIPNKNKQALIALLEAKYPGYHPVMELAAIANDDVTCTVCGGTGHILVKPITADSGSTICDLCVSGKAIVSMDMKFNANKEVAQYVTPKLKAVEHTGNIDSTQTHKHKVQFVSSK